MCEKPSRREFLRWTAGSLAGFGLAPLLPAARTSVPGGAVTSVDGELPPATVALRSLGGNFVFEPAGLLVEPGTRLTWLNMGDFHTATAFHPENSELLAVDVSLRIPEKAEPWHSGTLGLDAGSEFSHTFRVPGVHDYFCQPHYGFGMVGRVVVGAPDGSRPEAPPAAELNEASRDQMPSVDAILGPPGRAFEWSSRINGVLLLRAHGDPAAAPAERVADRMAGDDRLVSLLERSGGVDGTFSALERFVDGVRSGAGYEVLVGRAVEVKSVLSSAGDAAA
jgi:plastocyanin